ncbi:hypothetical protein [Thiofilum flexile]|uniref:hypothetical protein n=1 Tax=Thiofilum flexile TaxID=125627 RepID=UPI00035E1CB6|nr:hypothetical protein [Thiofilum flexile]
MTSNKILILKLMDQANLFFLTYKEKKIFSEAVRNYRNETDFDYISSLCAGVCSQLKSGKDFSEVDWGGLASFQRFNFFDQVIYERFFIQMSDSELDSFISCLCISQLMLDILRYEMNFGVSPNKGV